MRPIELPQPGLYTLSFYTFVYCPNENCDTDDSIRVRIRDKDFVYEEIFKTGVENGRIRDNQWKHESVDFNSKSNRIYVSQIFFYYFSILKILVEY